jgi:hypothetical protein
MALWPFDRDEQEWSEDYRLGELDVTVSNFLVGTVESFIDDVVLRVDTDPVKHMRLAALQRSRPLVGAETIESWRARIAMYPDKLVVALVEQSLNPEVLRGWAARDALAGGSRSPAVRDGPAGRGAHRRRSHRVPRRHGGTPARDPPTASQPDVADAIISGCQAI